MFVEVGKVVGFLILKCIVVFYDVVVKCEIFVFVYKDEGGGEEMFVFGIVLVLD